MSIFKERKEELLKKKELRDKGIYDYIPIDSHLPSLAKYCQPLQKSQTIILTASTGASKSKMARFLFIKLPYEVIKQKKLNIKYKLFLNALEETKEDIIDSLVLTRINELHKERITRSMLSGIGTTDALFNEIMALWEESLDYFKDLEEMFEVVHIGNGYGYYKLVRQYMYENGTYWRDGKQVNPIVKGKWTNDQNTIYKPNNPNHLVAAVTDHITLLTKEANMSQYDSIAYFSKQYSRIGLSIRHGVISGIIAQQNADSTSRQFSNSGKLVADRLIPTLENLGQVRIIKDDCTLALGLFAPERFGVESYQGYSMDDLGDCYRSLHLMKNRLGNGGVGKILSLFTDGLIETFEELPKLSDIKYQNYLERANKIL